VKWIIAFLWLVTLYANASIEIMKLTGGHNPWPPYINEDGSGLVPDILEAAFTSQGIEFDVKIAPFSRMMLLVENQEIDLIVALWWTEQRHKTMLFSKPYFHNELAIVGQRESKMVFRGAQSLRFRSIAMIRGYAYHELLQNIEHLRVINVLSLHACLELVSKGRADFAIADALAFNYEVSTTPAYSELKLHYPILVSWPLHIGVSRTHPYAQEIISRFNLGLDTIRRNGVYDQILARYVN
jgi:polar amino acid transport system substrate-binding protein